MGPATTYSARNFEQDAPPSDHVYRSHSVMLTVRLLYFFRVLFQVYAHTGRAQPLSIVDDCCGLGVGVESRWVGCLVPGIDWEVHRGFTGFWGVLARAVEWIG